MMPDPDVPLAESPRIRLAMEQFVEEAIDEAMDTLTNGSTPERNALIKMVLAETFRARAGDGTAEAEKLLALTRKNIQGVLEGDDSDSTD